MRIPINLVQYGEERLLLEFQGAFNIGGGDAFGGLPIGTLTCDGKGPPILAVGHHELQGKVVELKRPVAILVKGEKAEEVEGGTSRAVSYDVTAVIRKKIIFMIRPKALMDAASKGLGVLKKAPS
eukprot:m.308557 g.308557  ORF g.308557 m.308557 type:complete len:125 (+) comp27409_c0_seq1:149-523(+)